MKLRTIHRWPFQHVNCYLFAAPALKFPSTGPTTQSGSKCHPGLWWHSTETNQYYFYLFFWEEKQQSWPAVGQTFPQMKWFFFWIWDNFHILRRKGGSSSQREAQAAAACSWFSLLWASGRSSILSTSRCYFSFLKRQCCCNLQEEAESPGEHLERGLVIRTHILILPAMPWALQGPGTFKEATPLFITFIFGLKYLR